MGSPFIGELRLVGFNFAPVGWSLCQGQLVAISTNETLYALVGTFYGGDGTQTFALPNLQSRTAIHQGQGLGLSSYVIGQLAGSESITLTTQQIPSHNHTFQASQNTTSPAPTNTVNGNVLTSGVDIYANKTPTAPMAPGMMAASGQSLPHENRQPYLTLNWIISLYGIFPSQG
jgi:microcystin-dependent protein